MEKFNKILDYKYKVATQCFTYNQAPYICETLDGFTMQKTSFPVVFIVIDDASTDGEQDLLRRWAKEQLDFDDEKSLIEKKKTYGELFYARLKGSTNIYFSIILLSVNHHQSGKGYRKYEYISTWMNQSMYIAMCEGDDYWIDPYKLQTQVDFLDKNPDYGMCYTKYDICKNGLRQKQSMGGPSVEFEELLKENTIATLTTLYRYSLFVKYNITIKPEDKKWKMGDYPCWLWLSRNSNIGFIDKVTGVYRLLPESASHSKSIHRVLSFIDSKYEIQRYFNDYFNAGMSKEIQRTYYVHQLYEIAKYKDIKLCLNKLRLAIKNDPSFLLSYKGYMYLLRTCKNRLMNILKNIL